MGVGHVFGIVCNGWQIGQVWPLPEGQGRRVHEKRREGSAVGRISGLLRGPFSVLQGVDPSEGTQSLMCIGFGTF